MADENNDTRVVKSDLSWEEIGFKGKRFSKAIPEGVDYIHVQNMTDITIEISLPSIKYSKSIFFIPIRETCSQIWRKKDYDKQDWDEVVQPGEYFYVSKWKELLITDQYAPNRGFVMIEMFKSL